MALPEPIPPWMNRVVFDAQRSKSHVESFFFKANNPHRQRALWVRCTLFAGQDSAGGQTRFGETWAIVFDGDEGSILAAKNQHELSAITIDQGRPGVTIGPCTADEGTTKGVVHGAQGLSITWDLHLDDTLGPYRHFPADWMYRSRLAGTKIVSPHPAARTRGWVELAGGPYAEPQRLNLDGWYGMQGHNWGKRHTERYAWSHCNLFDGVDEPAFFEGFHAKAKLAGMNRIVTMACVVVGQRVFRFNTWGNLFSGYGEVTPTSWGLKLEGPEATLEGTITGDATLTAGLVYQNPKGPPAHCLNSKLAQLDLQLTPKAGGAPIRLRSTKAALEVAQLDTAHGVTMIL